MIDVQFTQKDGTTGAASFRSYAEYVSWTINFRQALCRYRAFRGFREIDSFCSNPFITWFNKLAGGKYV